MRAIPYIILGVLVSVSAKSFAEGTVLSLTPYGGGSVGIVQYADEETLEKRTVVFGGFPLGMGLSVYQGRRSELQIGGDFMLDPRNNQVSRTGAFFQAARHFWGGPPLVARQNKLFSVEENNRWFGGFVSRFYYLNYALVDAQNPNFTLKGTVLDAKIGLQAAGSLREGLAFGTMFLISAAVFPVSTNRLFPASSEFLAFLTISQLD